MVFEEIVFEEISNPVWGERSQRYYFPSQLVTWELSQSLCFSESISIGM